MKKGFNQLIVILFVAVILVGIVSYFLGASQKSNSKSDETVQQTSSQSSSASPSPSKSGTPKPTTKPGSTTVSPKPVQSTPVQSTPVSGQTYDGRVYAFNPSQQTVQVNIGTSGTYLVSITTTTRLVNKDGVTITFSRIKAGQDVRIVGTMSGTNIYAREFRVLSLSTSPVVTSGKVQSFSIVSNAVNILDGNYNQLSAKLRSTGTIVNKNGSPITINDIRVNHNVNITGIIGEDNTIDATRIQDLSI
jgi:hypothetical protein